MNDEDIGYIKAMVEVNSNSIEDLSNLVRNHVARSAEDYDHLRKDMQSMKDQLSMYRHLVMFLKAIGWISVCVLTLKFGDIPEHWEEFWK